ncbi:hypothetical protein M3M33_15055, partial [Loigolactobacillus coryniformis]|uniref:hypothetical protein n=1 Tax=Loigolactobacillus coryniformis TaxID=1610 RepID=UPI00201B1A73
ASVAAELNDVKKRQPAKLRQSNQRGEKDLARGKKSAFAAAKPKTEAHKGKFSAGHNAKSANSDGLIMPALFTRRIKNDK